MQAETARLRQEIESLRSGGKAAELRKELAEVDAELIEIRNRYAAEAGPAPETRRKLSDAAGALDETVREIRSVDIEIEELKGRKERLVRQIESLREEWFKVDAETFHLPEVDTICPTCNQPIPAAEIQKVQDEALAQFNEQKSRRLEDINTAGQDKKALLEKLDASIQEEFSKRQKLIKQKEAQEQTVDALREEIETARVLPPIEELAEYKRLNTQRSGLLRRIEGHQEAHDTDITKVQREIDVKESEIAKFKEQLAALEQHEKCMVRIEELKDHEKELAAKYEELEGQLHLCDEFTRQKVNLLEQRINSRFELAKFKLYDMQVNGGLKECCEVTFDGIPWGSLNSAMRLNVGLDIIDALSEHYGLTLPVWIDNAESVTDIKSTKAQQIQLVVDPDCPELTLKETNK